MGDTRQDQDPGLAFVAALSPAALDVLAERVAERVAPAASPSLLSTTEVAAVLGLHAKTVERAARDGRFPGARLVGRAWRIPLAAVETFGTEPAVRAAPPSTARRAVTRRARATSPELPRRAPRGRVGPAEDRT